MATYRALFAAADIGIVEIDLTTHRFLAANDAACRLLVFDRETLLGMTSDELVHPAYVGERDGLYAGLAATGVSAGEACLRTGSGAVWVRVHATYVTDPDGVVRRVVSLLHDLGARHRAESVLAAATDRFRAALSAVDGVVWTCDGAGRMTADQPAWSALTGQSHDDYRHDGWAAAVHPDDAGASIDAWRIAASTGRTFVFEHRIRRHDGAWRRFSVRAVPTFDEDGRLREWVGVHTDITDIRDTEARLEMLAARAIAERDLARNEVRELLHDAADASVYSSRDIGARLLAVDSTEIITAGRVPRPKLLATPGVA